MLKHRILTSVCTVAASAAVALGLVGCAGVLATLPAVIAYVQDAELIVSTIADFEKVYFAQKPDPTLQAKIEVGIARVRSAADIVARLASAGAEANSAQIDAAFADLKAAYVDLLQLAGPIGVTAAGDKLGATPGGGLVVPTPAVFLRKAAAK
jgi:hypothetical protein